MSRKPYKRKDVLEPPHDDVVGASVPLRDRARPLDHRRRLPRQHVALDLRPQGRAHDLLPGGDPGRLRRAQPRQAHSDPAAGRQPAVHRLQSVRDGVPGAVHRDRRRLRPGRSGPPQVPGALRDRLLALHLLRAVRGGLPRGRDPHGQGSARDCLRYDRGHMWLTKDELLNWNPQRDVAKPYPATRRP